MAEYIVDCMDPGDALLAIFVDLAVGNFSKACDLASKNEYLLLSHIISNSVSAGSDTHILWDNKNTSVLYKQ